VSYFRYSPQHRKGCGTHMSFPNSSLMGNRRKMENDDLAASEANDGQEMACKKEARTTRRHQSSSAGTGRSRDLHPAGHTCSTRHTHPPGQTCGTCCSPGGTTCGGVLLYTLDWPTEEGRSYLNVYRSQDADPPQEAICDETPDQFQDQEAKQESAHHPTELLTTLLPRYSVSMPSF
jgi:hypothetical protein